jgi:DNA anti-recombination protein RmuC
VSEGGNGMVNQAWQYGVLGIAVLVFGWVIYHLFNRYERREQVLTAERKEIHEAARNAAHAHALERETMRSQHQAALKALAEEYAKTLREDREAMQEREDQIRREFSELMESVAAESSKMAADLTAVLNKIYDRFLKRGR